MTLLHAMLLLSEGSRFIISRNLIQLNLGAYIIEDLCMFPDTDMILISRGHHTARNCSLEYGFKFFQLALVFRILIRA